MVVQTISAGTTPESSWGVVQSLQLVVRVGKTLRCVLSYGTSDPVPNPAELLLTMVTAEVLGMDSWEFFIYLHGKNLYGRFLPYPEEEVNKVLSEVKTLEEIIQEVGEGLSLRQMAEEIFNLRRKAVVVAYRSGGGVVRATTAKVQKVPDITIDALHKEGGWLGGAGIHFILRKWAEMHDNVVYLCPFQAKGKVYQIYQGIGRGLFVLVPSLKITPPLELQPSFHEWWVPMLWEDWMKLSEEYRKEVMDEIRNLLHRFLPVEETMEEKITQIEVQL